ncbi:MAG: hypothetical protein CMJ78_08560 [Planctomycetaceae bacterium]|nr:hypothetical protein [Planctomycetaceae bacterium]
MLLLMSLSATILSYAGFLTVMNCLPAALRVSLVPAAMACMVVCQAWIIGIPEMLIRQTVLGGVCLALLQVFLFSVLRRAFHLEIRVDVGQPKTGFSGNPVVVLAVFVIVAISALVIVATIPVSVYGSSPTLQILVHVLLFACAFTACTICSLAAVMGRSMIFLPLLLLICPCGYLVAAAAGIPLLYPDWWYAAGTACHSLVLMVLLFPLRTIGFRINADLTKFGLMPTT